MLTDATLDRLYAIPSEMQVVKMLHDRNCILNEAAMIPEIRQMHQVNHIDIVAYLPETIPGFMRGFKIDAKSHKKKFYNIFLETQTRISQNDGRRYPSWAFCAYGEDMSQKNRYLADIRDENNGVSFIDLIQQHCLIDINKPEKSNTVRIIDFFSDHIELLDHDIIIYSFIDINEFLKRTGGIDLAQRTQDKESNITHAMYITCEWRYWDSNYGRALYTFDKQTNKWIVEQKGVKNVPVIEKIPYWQSVDPEGNELSEKDNEYGLESFISFWQDLQRNGLTSTRFRRILGVNE